MFVIEGLAPEPFASLFDLDDTAIAARGARRLTVREPRCTPCRVSLEDAGVGEDVVLLPYAHQTEDTPYRASGPIFVRRTATLAFHAVDELPPMLQPRLLSLRAYDHKHWIRAAEVVEGAQAHDAVVRLLADPKVRYLHLHFARPGCFACAVKRN